MKDNSNNASNFALMQKTKWLLGIPCLPRRIRPDLSGAEKTGSILEIQILNISNHLKTKIS